ncbi:MAG: hypothetical protein ACRC8M_07475 [Cetobacterium sp.]
MRLQKTVLIFCILKAALFSAPEEAFVELEMKGQKNEFYRVLIDDETEEIYIGVGEFIDFTKIDGLRFDRKRRRVKGALDAEKEVDVRIPENASIDLDDDIFIKLKDLQEYFYIPNYQWDDERYILTLFPDFKTPREYSLELNNQRTRLAMAKKEQELEEEGDYIFQEKKLLAPGMLKFIYSNSNIEDNDYSFDIDYGTELLYGEFEMTQKIYPESDLDYIRLRYKEVFGEYYLIFGDFYLESDSIFDAERNLRGISFSKNEYYGTAVDNRTIIEGEAQNSNLVELYRNGNLEDFELPTDNKFKFTPLNISSSDNYTIKIYYKDGRVEVKDIYVLGNQNILNKGENDFVIQGGIGNDEKKNQYLAKYKYGLTKNITTTIGTSFLENRDGVKYDVLEAGVAYRFGLEKYPTLISGTLLEEFNSESMGFKGILEQKLPWDSNLIIRYEDYNIEISDRLRKDYSYNVDLSKNFRRFTGSVGYFANTYEDENLYQIYLNLDYTISRNFRMSLSNEYYEYSSTNEVKSNGYGTQIKLNYNGIKGIAAILEGKINYQEDKVIDDEIKLSLVKPTSEDSFFKNVDAAFEVGHSKEKGAFFEVRFTYLFDNNIYIEFPDIKTDNKETIIGGRIEKTVYLGNPLLPINNNNVTDGWVEGKVFVDENANGVMDENEDIYEGAEVTTSGGSHRVKENGKYIIGNISGGELHSIDVNRESIDPMLTQGKEIIKYKGSISSGVKVDIPLVPISLISGYIESDVGVDERRYDGLIANLDIVLKRGDEELKRSVTEIDGYYFFEDILPGEYTVEIIPNSKRYKGEFDKKELKVSVKSGREGDYYEDNNFLVKNIEIVESEILDDEDKIVESKKSEEKDEKSQELVQEKISEGKDEKNS